MHMSIHPIRGRLAVAVAEHTCQAVIIALAQHDLGGRRGGVFSCLHQIVAALDNLKWEIFVISPNERSLLMKIIL